jgi:Tol biopolymer transport system component
MKRPSILLSLAALAVVLASAIPAHATFPGKNGRIAFQKGSSSGTDIYTMNPDGSDVQQLTFFTSSGGSAQGESWSPDGRQIAFVGAADAVNGPFQLWIMNADASNQHLLLNDPAYADFVPSFSPDGSNIVFSRCGVNCAIFRINADGSGLKAVTHFSSDHDIVDWGPVYSPDGSTIAFTSLWRGGLIQAIYLMNADGSGMHSFSPPRLGSIWADWSPGGESLVFYSNDPFDCGVACFPLSSELWCISTENGKTTRLTFNNQHWHGIDSVPHDLNPSWSPQGDAIVFERDAPDFSSSALYVMNRDGSNLRQVLQLPSGRAIPPLAQGSFVAPKRLRPDRLKQIEQGGSFPRWGNAPQTH